LKKDHVCFAQEQLRDETFAERDQAGRFSRALWAKCGEAGLTGLHVPEAYGGRGYDAINLALAFEGLGYGTEDQGLLLALGAHLFGVVAPIIQAGEAAQKQKYLPKLADGSWMAARALSEPASSADLGALTTRADAEGAGFRITGEKTLC
jgi:alkylation response protein AidB-like acyl-CoA dehydrogenase